MLKAWFVKQLGSFSGDAKMYECEEGGSLPQYVAVSKINNMWGVETYIFSCDSKGAVTCWTELDGSQKGVVSHEAALRDAGYEVIERETV